MQLISKALAAVVAATCAGLLVASSAYAETKELTPQQKRMGDCAHASKGKKGDDYKQSMSACLKGDGPAPAATAAATPAKPDKAAKATPPAAAPAAASATAAAPSQQAKMKTCNAQAKEKTLKGDERKTFMSSCLKA